MTRDEYVNLVNTIAQEERVRIAERMTQIQETSENALTDMLAEMILQSAAVSARTAARIIEEAGLIEFDG